MRYLQYVTFVFFFIFIASCKKTTKNEAPTKEVEQSKVLSFNSESQTVDLVALQKQGKLKKTTIITVNDDPVYHSVKHYNALPLPELLKTHSAIKSVEIDNYQIIFECEDGYRPMMPLRKFLSVKSYIAVSDVDAPKGKEWSKIIKEGHEMKAAPFYLIYEGVSSKDTNFKWPYNIVKIHLIPNNATIAVLYPKEDKKAEAGFELFKKNCITCHAINKIGGNMGPELNYPKSVTEYWDKKQLKDFIKNPSSFRNGVKMPTLPNLSEDEIKEIVVYLNYMAGHKLEKEN